MADLVKIIFLSLLICFVGCSEKKEVKRLSCPYCSETYTVPTHITRIIVDKKLIVTCWGEIRRAAREGIKNNTIHYKK